MADDRKVIYIEVNSQKAIEGSAAATRALQAIEAQTAKTAAAVEKIESGFDMAALATKALVAVKVVKDLADKLSGLFKEARDAASAISDFSETLGVSTSFVQASMYSAAEHTVGLEKLTQGYTKASQAIGQAAQGDKASVELFDRLGVKILDSAGKLRSTEVILTESAASLLKIEEPAKRVTAAIDLFGKSGAQMIPMLSDLAAGSAVMASKAAAAGAIIEDKVIAQLSKLKSHAEESALKWNALVANIGAPIATQAMEAVNAILGDILKNIDRLKQDKKETAYGIPAARSDVANLQDQLDAQQGLLKIHPNNFSAKASAAALQKRIDAAKGAEAVARDQLATELLVSGTFAPTEPLDPEGKKAPTIKPAGGGGESPEDKYRKLTAQLGIAAQAQDAMSAAAARGDVAFEKQKVHLEAQQKTLEIFGKVLDDTDPRLVKVEQTMLRISQGKALEGFNVATTELEKQNVLLDAQIGLMNAAPDVQAREIALIKAKTEAQKAGLDVESDGYRARLAAVEQNERLKIQAEDLKKAQELWTAPLKSALESIQQTAADAFEGMLNNGKVNFELLGQIFKKIIMRMAAEFLALATVRPVMSVLVNAVSPGMARQFGLDSGSEGAGAGGMTGGGMSGGGVSGGGLFGRGGFGELFKGIGNSLSGAWDKTATFFGGGPALSPAGQAMPAGAGAMGMGGIGGLGIGWGQGLGAVAGLGMGAYQLLSGKGSTASTIGGIASMVGAGVSLIPGIGQIAGPIIGLLGGILPGLFGGGAPEPPPMQATGGLNFRGGKFVADGGAYGGASSVLGTLGGTGQGMAALLKAAGVTALDGQQGLTYQTYSKGDFKNATTFVNGKQWGQSSEGDAGLDTAAAHIAHAIMMESGSGISDTMRTGLSKFGLDNLDHAFSSSELNTVVGEISAFDAAMKGLGKTMTDAESAIGQIDERFTSLYDTAKKYGLDTGAIDSAKAAERSKYATGFGADIDKQLLGLKDPAAAAIAEVEAEREKLKQNNNYLLATVASTVDKTVEINELASLKLKKIAEDTAASQIAAAQAAADAVKRSVEGLQEILRRLQYGDLSTASPETTLSGTRGAYEAALAQSRAGDATATANLGSYVEAYSQAGRNYYGSSSGFQLINQQLQAAIGERIGTLVGGAGGGGAGGGAANSNAQVNAQSQQIGELMAGLQKSQNDNAELREQVRALVAQLARSR